MHNLLDLPYQERDDFVAVDLPYTGSHLAMFVVVPKQGRFEDVRKAVSEKWLKAAISVRATKSVSLALPKFTMTVGPFDLTESLKALGIVAAFKSDADFSGITDQGPLAIDFVVQKAFIGVDERGTEAAAATAVGVSGDAAPTNFVVLNVDRPFLFFIHDDNGIVLFSGHVVDPSKSE
jgi:serpin B